MRKTVPLLAALIVLIAVAPAAADKGGVPHHKAAPDPAFTCDGTNCTFLVTGLAADTDYQASIKFREPDGVTGCNLGLSAQTSDSTGALTFVAPEARVKCTNFSGYTGPGTVTAWVRAGDSTRFNDPPVLLSDGTQALITTAIS